MIRIKLEKTWRRDIPSLVVTADGQPIAATERRVFGPLPYKAVVPGAVKMGRAVRLRETPHINSTVVFRYEISI